MTFLGKSVKEKITYLEQEAKKIGCAVVIEPHPIMPYSTIAIIPNTKASKHALTLGSVDGCTFVNIDHKDMDKKGRNSRYYFGLDELESLFNRNRSDLKTLAKCS